MARGGRRWSSTYPTTQDILQLYNSRIIYSQEMSRWSWKGVKAATETPCLEPSPKFQDSLCFQAEAGVLRNREVLISESSSRQPGKQLVPAPLQNMVLSSTYKWLYLLTSTSQKQKKTKPQQSNQNLTLKPQSWQRPSPTGSIRGSQNWLGWKGP